MVICPNCQHKEIPGAIFCSKCGAQLVDMNISTHKIHTAERRAAENITEKLKPVAPASLQSWISLHIIESGQILPGRGWTLAQLSQADELRARMRGSAHPLSVLPGASAHAGAAGASAQPELYEPSVPVSRTLDT